MSLNLQQSDTEKSCENCGNSAVCSVDSLFVCRNNSAWVSEVPVEKHLQHIPRTCKHCNVASRFKKPKNWKKQRCWSVTCPACHKEFEVVLFMRGGRK